MLVNASASPVARMAAGLQLKNQLTSKDPQLKYQYQQRWRAIPVETREYIKKNVREFYSVADFNAILRVLQTSSIRGAKICNNVVFICE